MPADPSTYYQVGADVLPWKASTSSTAVIAADRGRDVVLALAKAALGAEFSDSWTKEATGTALSGQSPVADSIGLAPDPEMVLQRKAGWPLLCVYRDPEYKVDEFTLWRWRVTSQIHIDWIIGPLNIADTNKLNAFLQRAVKALVATFAEGGHPSYSASSGGRALQILGGDNPDDGGAGFSKWKLTRCNAGQAAFATAAKEAAKYWAVSCTLEVEELTTMPDDVGTPLQCATFIMGTGNDEGVIPAQSTAVTEEKQQPPLGAPDPVLD